MTEKKAERKRGLGRGLSALIGEAAPVGTNPGANSKAGVGGVSVATTGNGLRMLGTDQLQAGAFQPRQNFDADELKALAQSFGRSGILQPLVVRPLKGATDRFEIIAGERRWRAAQIAKLHAVPAVVQELSDSEALEVGIIENVQRADLNPMEESEAYQRLIDEFSYTQAELAEVVGKSRSHIANLLRLAQATPGMRDCWCRARSAWAMPAHCSVIRTPTLWRAAWLPKASACVRSRRLWATSRVTGRAKSRAARAPNPTPRMPTHAPLKKHWPTLWGLKLIFAIRVMKAARWRSAINL